MEVILIILGVISVIISAGLFRLCTLKLYKGRVVPIAPDEIPENHRITLSTMQKKLVNLGFELECHITRSKITQGQEWGSLRNLQRNRLSGKCIS